MLALELLRLAKGTSQDEVVLIRKEIKPVYIYIYIALSSYACLKELASQFVSHSVSQRKIPLNINFKISY